MHIGILVHLLPADEMYRFTSANYFYFFAPYIHCALVAVLSEKRKVQFSVAIGNEEFTHESFPRLANGNSKNEIRRTNRRIVSTVFQDSQPIIKATRNKIVA